MDDEGPQPLTTVGLSGAAGPLVGKVVERSTIAFAGVDCCAAGLSIDLGKTCSEMMYGFVVTVLVGWTYLVHADVGPCSWM